jgi:hypothetical protein
MKFTSQEMILNKDIVLIVEKGMNTHLWSTNFKTNGDRLMPLYVRRK